MPWNVEMTDQLLRDIKQAEEDVKKKLAVCAVCLFAHWLLNELQSFKTSVSSLKHVLASAESYVESLKSLHSNIYLAHISSV